MSRGVVEPWVYRAQRGSRALAGFFCVMFGVTLLFVMTLEALTSFAGEDAATVLLFWTIGAVLFPVGTYLLLCVPVVEIDARRGQVAAGRSCILFNTRSMLPFASIDEVGLTEAHYSDAVEGGVYYTVELRAKGRQRLALPGTKSRDGRAVSEEARTLARIIDARFQPRPRRVFTGQWVLASGRDGR